MKTVKKHALIGALLLGILGLYAQAANAYSLHKTATCYDPQSVSWKKQHSRTSFVFRIGDLKFYLKDSYPERKVKRAYNPGSNKYRNRHKKHGKTYTVNVPLRRGGYVPVVLTKYGKGYIGPQGEYYYGFPTVNELKVLYGRRRRK